MPRFTLIALTSLCLLLAGIAHVNASGRTTADAQIAALEARVAALEAIAIHPYDVPIFPLPANSEFLGTDLSQIDQKDVIPVDPSATLDLVCFVGSAYQDESAVYPGLSNLRCVRYDRFQPFEYQSVEPVR